MIQRLFGHNGGENVTAAVGHIITAVRLADNVLRIGLDDGSVLSLQDDGQSCCEARYMRTDDDLSSFVGATLIDVELADAPPVEGDYDVHEVQFLNVKTSKGVLALSNHNEHNGYYGGFAITAHRAMGDA